MKHLFLLFVIVLVSVKVYAQSDTSRLITLSDDFCYSTYKPLPFTAHSQLYINCDTVYLLNRHTMQLYRAVANELKLRTNSNTCKAIIDNLEDRLEAQNKSFYELHEKYLKLDSTSQKVINDTRNSLNQVNNTLTKTQTDVQGIDKKMDDLKDTIRKSKKQVALDKLKFGGIGIIIGVLLGLLIAH